MNTIFSSTIPPPLLEEVPLTFFSSCNHVQTFIQLHRYTTQISYVSAS